MESVKACSHLILVVLICSFNCDEVCSLRIWDRCELDNVCLVAECVPGLCELKLRYCSDISCLSSRCIDLLFTSQVEYLDDFLRLL